MATKTTTTKTSGAVGKNISTLSNTAIQTAVGAKADGIYGPKTTASVKAFQSANGLVADGIVGPKTQAAILAKQSSTTPVNDLANQNNTGIATTADGTGSVISTSKPVVAQEKSIISDLQSMISNNTADVTTAHTSYLDMLDKQSQMLDQRLQSQLTGVNAQFDTAGTRLKDTQKSETGQFSSTLQRIGGYLGDSASATGAMVNLNQQHTFQLNDLEAKRAAAVQEATQAIADKQFELAREKTKEAKSYAKDLADSKQQYFNNVLKLNDFQKEKIQDDLKMLAYVDPSQVSPQQKAQIDNFYGTPGFTDSYLAITNAAAKAKSEKDIMEARKSTLEFLQNIPAGQKITMPDGTQFTGMGKAGDVATFMQTDSAGIGHLITYNKLTGAKSISNLGVVGKGSGSGGGSTPISKIPIPKQEIIKSQFQIDLDNTAIKNKAGKITGYNPVTYIELRKELINSPAASMVQIIDKQYLNPKNGFFDTNGITELRKKGIYYNDSSISDVNPVIIDNNGDVQTEQ